MHLAKPRILKIGRVSWSCSFSICAIGCSGRRGFWRHRKSAFFAEFRCTHSSVDHRLCESFKQPCEFCVIDIKCRREPCAHVDIEVHAAEHRADIKCVGATAESDARGQRR